MEKWKKFVIAACAVLLVCIASLFVISLIRKLAETGNVWHEDEPAVSEPEQPETPLPDAETPAEPEPVQQESVSLVGRWKVTNAGRSFSYIYDFSGDGRLRMTLADFGSMPEDEYGDALELYLQENSYLFDEETMTLTVYSSFLGAKTTRRTSVSFGGGGSTVEFADWNESCQKTALSGLKISASSADLVGSWLNLALDGGLDLLAFGPDGSMSFSCSQYNYLTNDEKLEIYNAAREKADYLYSFGENCIIVYETYLQSETIYYVIYGDYLALITLDDSGAQTTTYRRAEAVELYDPTPEPEPPVETPPEPTEDEPAQTEEPPTENETPDNTGAIPAN